VLRLLAARAPIVVALEDVQWLDSSSLAVLQIALRRMREDRVGVFATLRTTSDGASSFELTSAFP
jgi:predicted ATPase